MTAGQFQPFIHMRLQHRCTAKWIIEGVVGIGFILLILNEPPRGMQFADVVIQRARANQIHIGSDGSRPLFGQAADHQGVLKRAGGFAGKPPQQRTLLIGKFQ